jgi:hypothetical protein
MIKSNVVKLASDQVSDEANFEIKMSEPYSVRIALEGTSDLLFHRWNNEAIEEKSQAKKGSAAKKTDNVESYVWRDDEGNLCLPAEYVRGAMIVAAKFRQDPRSPRKSAMDLFKAAIVSLTPLGSLGVKDWDYLDKRRVTVQRAGITRTRPAMRKGWCAEMDMMINLPEYVDPAFFREVLSMAGRLIGVGDFRPTYGRFDLIGFEVI